MVNIFITKLNEILEIISPNDIELHVKEVEKRGTRKEIEKNGYNLAGFDHFKSEKLAEKKRINYKNLECMIYRMELFFGEIEDTFDVKDKTASINGYILPPSIYEITDINLILQSLFPNEVEVKIT